MKPSEIIAALNDADGVLPVMALRAATARRDEVAPLLIAEIERATQASADEFEFFDSAFFGWFLLAEWRETAGYRPVLQLLRRDSDDLHLLFGDAITEAAHRVFISLFDGDPQPLFELALDEKADQYVRSAAFDALAALAVKGELSRERLASFLRESFDRLEPRDGGERLFTWVGWVEAVATLGLDGLTPLVKKAFDEGWVDESMMSFDDFRQDRDYAIEHPDSPFRVFCNSKEPWEDTIAELSTWHGFSEAGRREREEARRRERDDDSGLYPREPSAGAHGAQINPFKDVGRNDPCPCGSGKKYKKCCLG